MKRESMICINCIKFDPAFMIPSGFVKPACRLNPQAAWFDECGHVDVDPKTHWCSQGEWWEWSERVSSWEAYKWGEWMWETPNPNIKIGGTE